MIQHNAHEVAARFTSAAQAIRAELSGEMSDIAQQVAARMRVAAPKFRSTLANSIAADRRGEFEWFIGPHVDWALAVEKGRKPGKGLPNFFDPAAASAVAWLESRIRSVGAAGPVNPAWRRARLGSRRRTDSELELRHRYFAWSKTVKLQGIRAYPFVKPTADEFRPLVAGRLAAAVHRGAQQYLRGRA